MGNCSFVKHYATTMHLRYQYHIFSTCPLYSNNYICKHVVAVGLRLKFENLTPDDNVIDNFDAPSSTNKTTYNNQNRSRT